MGAEVGCIVSVAFCARRFKSEVGVQRIGEVKISAVGDRGNYEGGFLHPRPSYFSRLLKSYTGCCTIPHTMLCCKVDSHLLVMLSCVMAQIITREI